MTSCCTSKSTKSGLETGGAVEDESNSQLISNPHNSLNSSLIHVCNLIPFLSEFLPILDILSPMLCVTKGPFDIIFVMFFYLYKETCITVCLLLSFAFVYRAPLNVSSWSLVFSQPQGCLIQCLDLVASIQFLFLFS